MAQRVYLIPPNNKIIASLTRLIVRGPEQADEAWKVLRKVCGRQRRIAFLSRSFAAGIAQNAMPVAGLPDYNTITAMRPYFITTNDPAEAAAVVTQICKTEDENDAFPIFQEEAKRLGKAWLGRKIDVPVSDDSDGEMWMAVRAEIGKLRAMRHCYREQRTYSAKVLKELATTAEFRMWSLDETESVDVGYGKIPALYGNALGALAGRLFGQAEPSWWMGRNFWIGLLCFSRLSMMDKLKVGKLQDELVKLGRNPAELFRDLAVPAFEHGFDKTCPGYSTGLYFSPIAVTSLLSSLQGRRAVWESLTQLTTKYPPADVKLLLSCVEEALIWASTNERGFMEGDELVGAYGAR